MFNVFIIIINFFIFYSIIICLVNLFWRKKHKYIKNNDSLSILIPARNEEENLSKCLNSIIKSGTLYKEILIYDDHSTDNTEEEILKFTKIDKRIKKAKTKKLEKGWIGKSFACYQLGIQSNSDWIVYIDADTEINGRIENLISIAKKNKVTMLSAWPKIKMDSQVEKIFMPLLNFVVFTLCPVVFSKDLKSENLGIAHGACILFNKKSYIDNGGHQLVKNDLFEDTRLARIWRNKKENTYCINGSNIISVKMYNSFFSIWNGFKKNYYPSFTNDFSFIIFQLVFFISYVFLPFFLIFLIIFDSIDTIKVFLLILSFLPKIIINIKFRYNLISIIFHPIIVLIMLFLGFSSWWNFRFGKGLIWKDRIYEK
tara:strand:+ start:6076 stop:7185 length:1110 start_codon:yes stop_codon:yes gene_type:complete